MVDLAFALGEAQAVHMYQVMVELAARLGGGPSYKLSIVMRYVLIVEKLLWATNPHFRGSYSHT